jgi:predicted amidohydrolase
VASQASDTVRVAAIQATPVFLDRAASLDKAIRLIAQAAERGAALAAFGEGWLPGYPIHAWRAPESELWWELAAEYLNQAIDVPGPDTEALCQAALESNIDVVIGVSECDPITHGTLYSTQLFIGREGTVAGRHRKLKPTLHERVVWADGDAIGLQVHQRDYGLVSGLSGGEHQMVLPTYALAEQGTQIHVASWPGLEISAPNPPMSAWPRQHLLSRAFASQAGCYVLCVAGTLTRDAIPVKYREYLTQELTGDSVVIDPRGEIIAGPITGENIIIADCSMALVRTAKVAFDCAGHASRSDQLKFTNQATADHDAQMSNGAMQDYDSGSQPMNIDSDPQSQPGG